MAGRVPADDPLQFAHTFVVPAYGNSPYLRDCLASLGAQSLPSQIVVTTSTPFDGLQEIAAGFGARLAIHAPNVGIGRDWNFALGQASTPWVTLAHQDDIYLPGFAAQTMELAARDPETSLVLTSYGELIDGVRRSNSPMLLIKRLLLELGFLGRLAIPSTAAKLRLLRFGCAIPCPSVTLRRPGIGALFREDLKVNLDWDAWIRLARTPGAFAYARDVLMLHRIHGGSETSEAIRAGVRASEDLAVFKSLWPESIAKALARAYSHSYEVGSG